MKEGTLVEQHLKEMKELTDRLAAIGAPVKEEDQVVTLLGSLPPSYSTLVTTLEAKAGELTLSHVQQALINEEQKRKEKSHKSQTDSALVNVHGRKKGRQVKCFGCEKLGHYKRDCPSNKTAPKGEYYKSDHKAKTVNDEGNSSKENESDSEGVFTATVISEFSARGRKPWLIDSGASRHMTCEINLLIPIMKSLKQLRKSDWEMVEL